MFSSQMKHIKHDSSLYCSPNCSFSAISLNWTRSKHMDCILENHVHKIKFMRGKKPKRIYN